MSANGLKYRNNVASFFAGQDGAAVNEDAGAVHARHGNTAGGHIFVTAANGHKAIKTLGTHYSFNGVCDHLTRHERVAHTRRTHGYAIRYGNGVEQY